MTNNTQAEIIKCLKQELTDSMIPALTRIDMEMMKLHHKFETVLTKIDKHESMIERLIATTGDHGHRLEQFIVEARELNAKILEHFAQLKKELPFMVPLYPPRPPPPGPRIPPPGGFRFPPPYDHFGYRSPAEFSMMPGHPLSYYQQQPRKDHGDKKKASGKNRDHGEASTRQFTRTQTVLPSSAGYRTNAPHPSPAAAAASGGGMSSSQQWTRRGTGVFTSDEESEDDSDRSGAGALVDPAALDSPPLTAEQHLREISHVTALMKTVTTTVTKKQQKVALAANDGNNNSANNNEGSIQTATEDDQLLWDDRSWGLNGDGFIVENHGQHHQQVYMQTAVSLSPSRPSTVVVAATTPAAAAENAGGGSGERKPPAAASGRAKRAARCRKAGRELKNV